VASGIVVVRAAQVQTVQGRQWRAAAAAQHRTDHSVVASRGGILDRDGTPLAVTRESYRVSVAPGEVEDVAAVRSLLRRTLDISAAAAKRATDPKRRWHVLPGRYQAGVKDALSGVRGVYLEREIRRYYPHGDLARGVLGAVIDDEGRGGIEQVYDSLLRGRPGREVVAHDPAGQPIPGETYLVRPPVPGGQVVLTLDLDLQEMAQQALEEAIEENEAEGGDVVVTDPRTGEVLALVSIHEGRKDGVSAINTPYEPGSTLKPFTVAGLLSKGLTSLRDTVNVGEGTWAVAGRVLHDVHSEGRMSVADALRISSNVGIAKAAQAFSPGQQYENLRDFGFGTPTGIELPGEVAGVLRRPRRWSAQSSASLAIGYEISVTPLQMAMAYGALANEGMLMQPYVIREVRDPSGAVVEHKAPRVVRRVVPPHVARQVGRVLVDVVEDGTGTRARLGTFRVAGKSGTSRAYTPDGGYRRGEYYASFVGFFPADDPQLVIVVKLDRPRAGTYYGGSTAAPVTRATMEAALAARATPLDRNALLRSVRARPAPARTADIFRFAAQPIDPPAPPETAARGGAGASGPAGGVPVPDVAGLPTRVAARRLHRLGLRVIQLHPGPAVGTLPGPGARVVPGDTIRLLTGVDRPDDGGGEGVHTDG